MSPRALVALKGAGVSEKVIEAMLAAETAKKQAAAAPQTVPVSEPAAPQPSEEFAKLSAMIDRLAAQQEAAEAARRAPDPPKSTDSSPRAWILNAADKTALAPTIAQVAFTDEKGGDRLKTLQGLAGKALAFANPAVSGIATTLGGLFRSDNEHRTAVWALAGTSASRELRGRDGVRDRVSATRPAWIPTRISRRSCSSCARTTTTGSSPRPRPRAPRPSRPRKTRSSRSSSRPSSTRIGRGHYRVQAKDALGPGEYALVLRPIVKKERRRKSSDASLGELLGGGRARSSI